jgi:hypothetical protein
MLHAYVERFDVMGGRENILGWDREVNKALDNVIFMQYHDADFSLPTF